MYAKWRLFCLSVKRVKSHCLSVLLNWHYTIVPVPVRLLWKDIQLPQGQWSNPKGYGKNQPGPNHKLNTTKQTHQHNSWHVLYCVCVDLCVMWLQGGNKQLGYWSNFLCNLPYKDPVIHHAIIGNSSDPCDFVHSINSLFTGNMISHVKFYLHGRYQLISAENA